jgi:hypothetical protein
MRGEMRNLGPQSTPPLDGCCDHTKFSPDETFIFTHLTLCLLSTFLYGRKTHRTDGSLLAHVAKTLRADKSRFVLAQAFIAINKIIVLKSGCH